jgi:MFS family permease
MAAAPSGFGGLLRDRSFRAFFVTQATGDAGYAVYAISIVWLGYRVSGSALVVGVLLGVEFGVYALSFVAGAVIDRVRDLRTVLLIGYPLQALGAFALAGLLFAGLLSVPLLLVLVALLSFVWDFTWTASNALPPSLVPSSELLRANSLVSAVSGGNQIAGYAVGGSLLLLLGPADGQLLYGILEAVAGAVALFIPAVPRPPSPRGLLEGLRDGFRYLATPGAASLRELAAYGALQGAVSLAPPLLITLLSARSYAAPAATYGILFTSYAVGGVVGSLALGQWNPRRRLAAVVLGASAMEGALVLAAVAAVPALPPSIAAWFGVGMVDGVLWQVLLSYVQSRAPRELLGRTITDVYVFRGTARAAGAVALGALGVILAPGALGLVVGAIFLGIAATGYLAFGALRNLAY